MDTTTAIPTKRSVPHGRCVKGHSYLDKTDHARLSIPLLPDEGEERTPSWIVEWRARSRPCERNR